MTLHTAKDIDRLHEYRFFSHLDYYFSQYMGRIYKTDDDILKLTCALLSRSLSMGDLCIHPERVAGKVISLDPDSDHELQYPDFPIWNKTLKESSMVSAEPLTPLVMDEDGRVFMARYYDYRRKLVENIAMRVKQRSLYDNQARAKEKIAQVFDPADKDSHTQATAAVYAVTHCFTVISGGPGTGKTYLTGVIRDLMTDAVQVTENRSADILHLAPTGKAASRMTCGQTIHSALKPLGDGSGFRHNRDNPLKADMVIIDEASMIDMVLFQALLDAISLSACVVILGDADQLASVQAGSIFSEICSCKALKPSLFTLTVNFRSGGRSDIERLGKAIARSDDNAVEKILLDPDSDDIRFLPLTIPLEKNETFQEMIVTGFHSFLKSENHQTALSHVEDFKVLCAHNQGTFGTLPINHLCENILRNPGLSGINSHGFKKIIMVTVNDYRNELFNGDTGVLTETDSERTAVFDSREDQLLELLPDSLSGYETAFAITIHKSQGSEYNEVFILMPEKPSPVLSRQLLYTGVTRARKKVTISGDINLIRQAVRTSVVHTSGVEKALNRRLEQKI